MIKSIVNIKNNYLVVVRGISLLRNGNISLDLKQVHLTLFF